MTQSSNKISILIAIYNTSKTLRRCLDSVINQSLKDIEIILVNDCSPDSEDDAICQEYANQNKRIIYIHHEKNLGLGGARNTGIKVAHSEFILFIDSDDWISSHMAETMYNKAVSNNADVVVCGYTKTYNSRKDYCPYSSNEEKLLKGKDGFKAFFAFDNGRNYINPASWNKLWRKSLITDNDLYFPLNMYDQDFAHTPQVLFFADRVLLIKECLYFYYQNTESVTKNINEKHVHDPSRALNYLRDFLIEQNALNEFKAEYWKAFLKGRVYAHYGRILTHSKDIEQRNRLLKATTEKLITEIDLDEIFEISNNETLALINQCLHDIAFNTTRCKWIKWIMLPPKEKSWMIAVEVTKKLHLYKLLRPLGQILKSILKKH